MLGLGGYPLVSLAEARNAAFANRQRARADGDPRAEERHGQGAPTVEEAAAEVLEQQRPGWRNAEARAGLAAQSARLCVPAHRGDARVRGDHGRRAGHPHPDLARQARDRTAGAAADRCRDEVGRRHGLPTGQPGGAMPSGRPSGGSRTVVQHMRALPHGAVADALATVRASQASVTTKRCVRVPGADGGRAPVKCAWRRGTKWTWTRASGPSPACA